MHAAIVTVAWVVFALVVGLLPIAVMLWLAKLPVRGWRKWQRMR